jgi:2',3'-cyclic-nucleotide 2'-phosphodiesterase (5'-nucleotidase family)
VNYDLLTIGNHELYVTEIAYETFSQFSKVYGDKYITSNVQIWNNATGEFKYIGSKYRYFTTPKGLRIMAFGVLFDFTGNSKVTKVTKTADLVKQKWFLDAVNFTKPIDLFVIIGHNPVRPGVSTSTFGTLYKTIRGIRPDIPIQAFGGHSHIRDFVVYDSMSTGLESGRYCETVGWLSLSGIKSKTFHGKMKPYGVPHPTQKAVNISATTTTSTPKVSSSSTLLYSRRYLDWNRLTFAYHAPGSQSKTFDTPKGHSISNQITSERKALNLTSLYGCAPQTYCQYCTPYGDDRNIYTLMVKALAATVVNASRAEIPRLILIHKGNIRFDLVQGPFTYDDSFIVSPFKNTFQFISDVPYEIASQILGILNAGPAQKRSELTTSDFDFTTLSDSCVDPTYNSHALAKHTLTRRNPPVQVLGSGYTTTDDFGTTGDDTPHSKIPNYDIPNDVQANASFPIDGSMPATVDLIFPDFVAKNFIVPALQKAGAKYTDADIEQYMPKSFTTNDYLPEYARKFWQSGVPNCPVGQGVQ